jgi:multiple sugar transport system substrate-binding protein
MGGEAMVVFFLVLGGIIASIVLRHFLKSELKNEETNLLVFSWGDLEENQVLIDLINDFMKLNPFITVALRRTPYVKYSEMVLAFLKGRGPDVIFVEVNNFAEFFHQRILEPLDSYVKTDHLDFSDFYPAVLDRFTSKGQTYVLPRDTAPWCLVYYNKSAFDEANVPYPKDDWNWDQFVETALKVQKKSQSGEVLRWGLIDDKLLPSAWIFSAGGSFADDVHQPTRWTFAVDPLTLKGIQFRYDLIHKYKVSLAPSKIAGFTESEGSDMFRFGSAAMYLSGLKWTPHFREITNFKWDVAMLPKGPDGDRAFATGGSGYAITRQSKNKEIAWKLVKYLTGEEAERKRMASGLAQPALRKMASSDLFLDRKDPLNKKILIDAVQYVKYFPLCGNWQEVENLITTGLEKVWEGDETPEQAMEKLRLILRNHPPLVVPK